MIKQHRVSLVPGVNIKVYGYIARSIDLVNKKMIELEHTLGFAAGRLKEGAVFLRITEQIRENDFDFSFTSLADHQQKQQFNPLISSNSSTAIKFGMSLINSQTQFIKVIPISDFNPSKNEDDNFPAAINSIPQYKLRSGIGKSAVVVKKLEKYDDTFRS